MSEFITVHGSRYALKQCGGCGVWYIVPEIVDANHREHGGYSSCSNGHSWGWRTGAEQRRQDELRLERDRLKQDAARLEEELVAQERRTQKAEQQVLQLQRRATSGVCPCCKRSFANVRRHMRTKHANVAVLENAS